MSLCRTAVLSDTISVLLNRAAKYHKNNGNVNKHCGVRGMNLMPAASGKFCDNDSTTRMVGYRLPKWIRYLGGIETT